MAAGAGMDNGGGPSSDTAMNHRLTALLSTVLLAAVVVAATAAGNNSQHAKPTSLPDEGPPWRPTPATRVAMEPVNQRDQGMWETQVPVVNGKPLILPEDALLYGWAARSHCHPVNIPQGLTCLPTPLYTIVRDGEVASVSAVTGEFQIGMDHEDTFEFLVNQLGRDKMQLVYTGIYERRWGPFRADYIREDR